MKDRPGAVLEVTLRAATAADVEQLHGWDNSDASTGAWDEPGRSSREALLERWVEQPSDPTQRGRWIVMAGAVSVGTATWIRHPMDDWVGLIGIMIGEPAWRGRGIGTAAHRCIVDWLFGAHADLAKLEAITDVENAIERRVLARVGFQFEGILRRRNRLRGDWRDMAFYGLLREEWRPQSS